VDSLLFAPFVVLLPARMQQYLSGAANLQDSQQQAAAGGNSRLSLKLLSGRERLFVRNWPVMAGMGSFSIGYSFLRIRLSSRSKGPSK
jgi:hypothetical protein